MSKTTIMIMIGIVLGFFINGIGMDLGSSSISSLGSGLVFIFIFYAIIKLFQYFVEES